jgi:hypothetical protein
VNGEAPSSASMLFSAPIEVIAQMITARRLVTQYPASF